MGEKTAAHYTVDTALSVDAAIRAVEKALAARQFGVLWHLDISEKLKEKGLSGGLPFHILEVCSPPRAQAALNTNQKVGYFLPCKVVVYATDAGNTRIGLLRPRLMTDLLADPRLDALADEVDALLSAAIEEAASGASA